jgi:hypothetical protein
LHPSHQPQQQQQNKRGGHDPEINLHLSTLYEGKLLPASRDRSAPAIEQ